METIMSFADYTEHVPGQKSGFAVTTEVDNFDNFGNFDNFSSNFDNFDNFKKENKETLKH